MTTTDELRRLLDERGVKLDGDSCRTWFVARGVEWLADETGSGLMLTAARMDDHVERLTPAQAIAATLGESMTDTEKAALERRIDELCAEVEKYRNARDASADLATKTIDRIRELEAEVERLHADQAHWELGNCPSCPNIADLQEALEQNAKLRELVDYMTPLALYAASERERDHMRELGVTA